MSSKHLALAIVLLSAGGLVTLASPAAAHHGCPGQWDLDDRDEDETFLEYVDRTVNGILFHFLPHVLDDCT